MVTSSTDLLLVSPPELRRAEVQMAVPGPTRALTGSADRKLEEGQRVRRYLDLQLKEFTACF